MRRCRDCGLRLLDSHKGRPRVQCRACRLRRKSTHSLKCKNCGMDFPASYAGKKYCSDQCKAPNLIRNQKKTCIVCGGEFTSRLSTAKCCSRKCANIRSVSVMKSRYDSALNRKRRNRSGSAKRRILLRLARVESFNNLEIFERDRWICGICGYEIDKNLKTPHPRSPSIDHIIPLGRGGLHSRDNVQAAHFGCNSRKAARL